MTMRFFVNPYKYCWNLKHVEADSGYVGEASMKVKCPASVTVPEERNTMMCQMRSKHETVNDPMVQAVGNIETGLLS